MTSRRFQFRLRTWFVVMMIVAVRSAVCLPALKAWQQQQAATKRSGIKLRLIGLHLKNYDPGKKRYPHTR
jgi:type II secretory pathway pseudopilin PulG